LIFAVCLAGGAAPGLVNTLASIGTDQARDALVTVSQGPPVTITPHTRQAAVEALHTLDAIRDRDSRPPPDPVG
jgi:hypothetical protein